MLWDSIRRLVREDAGMEMVEWSIVGVIFAVASAMLWSTLKAPIGTAVGKVANCVGDSSKCPRVR